jgi:hypothetical protein
MAGAKIEGLKMKYPAASCGVFKTSRNEASFGEYDPKRFNQMLTFPEHY